MNKNKKTTRFKKIEKMNIMNIIIKEN